SVWLAVSARNYARSTGFCFGIEKRVGTTCGRKIGNGPTEPTLEIVIDPKPGRVQIVRRVCNSTSREACIQVHAFVYVSASEGDQMSIADELVLEICCDVLEMIARTLQRHGGIR